MKLHIIALVLLSASQKEWSVRIDWEITYCAPTSNMCSHVAEAGGFIQVTLGTCCLCWLKRFITIGSSSIFETVVWQNNLNLGSPYLPFPKLLSTSCSLHTVTELACQHLHDNRANLIGWWRPCQRLKAVGEKASKWIFRWDCLVKLLSRGGSCLKTVGHCIIAIPYIKRWLFDI